MITFKCDGCGKTCDCSPCRCETCPDPSVTVHPPDCDCIDCICENCPDTRIHPENCDCSKCECDRCPDESHLNIITEFLKQIQCSCQQVEDCFHKTKPDRCGVKDLIILAMSKELKLKVGGNVLSNLLINLFSNPKVLDMLSEPEASVVPMDRLSKVKNEVAKILAKPNRCEELMKDWQEYVASTRKDVATSAYDMAGDVNKYIGSSTEEEPVHDGEKEIRDCPCGCSDTKQHNISCVSELYKRSSSPTKRSKPCCSPAQEKKTKSRHTKKSLIRTTCQPPPCDRIPTPTTSNDMQVLMRCIKCEPIHSKGPKMNLSPMEFEDMRRLEDDAILVKWKRPANQSVIGYELTVNGKLMYRVRNAARTSAILYGLRIDDCLKFNLYALSNEGRCSPSVAATFQP